MHKTLSGEPSPQTRPELHVALDFARKLTLVPESITCEDCDLLKFAGLTGPAIQDVVLIVIGFNLINRLADAFHFETPSKYDFFGSARFLRYFGYRDLAGPRPWFGRRTWIKVPHSHDPYRTCSECSELIKSTLKWLEFLTSIGRGAYGKAPDVANRVTHLVMYEPTRITQQHVTELQSRGCTDESIFNLIISAAAAAALLRLNIGLRAVRSVSEPHSALSAA